MEDRIERWMTDAGTVRVLVATTTQAVAEAVCVARIGPPLARLYGNLLTGTVLMQLAQCPADRVQCLIEHEGWAGALLADVWPGPEIRGRASGDAASDLPADAPAALVVSREGARAGSLYQSRGEVAHSDVATALEQFCLRSEQSAGRFSPTGRSAPWRSASSSRRSWSLSSAGSGSSIRMAESSLGVGGMNGQRRLEAARRLGAQRTGLTPGAAARIARLRHGLTTTSVVSSSPNVWSSFSSPQPLSRTLPSGFGSMT